MITIVQFVLWLAPVVLTLACVGIAVAVSALGTPSPKFRLATLVSIVVITAIAALLHAGYFLAPWWWGGGRRYWALGLMLPLAITVLFLILAEPGLRRALLMKPGKPKSGSWRARTAFPLVVVALMVYWAPPALMLVAPTAENLGPTVAMPLPPTPGRPPAPQSPPRDASAAAPTPN